MRSSVDSKTSSASWSSRQPPSGMGAEKEKEGHRRVALGHVVAAGVSAFEGATGGAEGASGSGIAVVGVDVQPMDH